MSNVKMTDKQKVTTMADSDYVFGNFGGKVGQMSIPDFRSQIGSTTSGDSPDLSSLQRKVNANTTRISAVEYKNEEQDSRIANAEAVNIKQNERLLNYVYPKLYQINEGAGALPFDGMYSGSASVLDGRKTVAEDGYTYKVVFALMLKKFLLQEISPGGVTIGFYEYWDKIISGRGSSEDYTRRDCLYYVYTEGEGSTYYYIDSNGVKSEQSATYLLRRLVDKNADAIVVLKTTTENAQNKLNNYSDTFPQNPVASLESNGLMSVADKVKVDNYPEQFVLDLGIVESQAYGEREAAKSEVAGNRNISFIRFQVRGVKELKTTLIMQWPNGIHETAQIMCVDKQQWRRNVTGATGVKGATTNVFKWERTAPHSIDYDEQRRIIQLKDYENQTVSQGVELPLATSSQHGLMSISDKEKISAMESKLSALEARVAALENK